MHRSMPTQGITRLHMHSSMPTRGTVLCRARAQVQKHREKMQAEKENAALEKISALMPQLGTSLHIAALKEADFEVEPAVAMLRRFHTDHEEQLKALHKVRRSGRAA